LTDAVGTDGGPARIALTLKMELSMAHIHGLLSSHILVAGVVCHAVMAVAIYQEKGKL
jgi:hypothetical protein